jgi:hypothetical protein
MELLQWHQQPVMTKHIPVISGYSITSSSDRPCYSLQREIRLTQIIVDILRPARIVRLMSHLEEETSPMSVKDAQSVASNTEAGQPRAYSSAKVTTATPGQCETVLRSLHSPAHKWHPCPGWNSHISLASLKAASLPLCHQVGQANSVVYLLKQYTILQTSQFYKEAFTH